MEINYYLIDDCAHNLSELFCIRMARSFSSITQKYKSFVFNIKHILEKISYHEYYKFHNLLMFTFTDQHNPQYLSQLNRLKYISFQRNESDLHMLTKLTTLREIRSRGFISPEIYSRLISLRRLETETLDKIEYCPSLINLTIRKSLQRIRLSNSNEYSENVTTLTVLTNLRKLSCNSMDLHHLSLLTRLKKLQVANAHDITFTNNSLTECYLNRCENIKLKDCIRLKILSVANSCKLIPLQIINCSNLIQLNLRDFKQTISIDNIDFNSFVHLQFLKIKFGRFCGRTPEYFKLQLSSKLIKLTKLYLSKCVLSIDSLVANNLIELNYQSHNNNILNFESFTKLTLLKIVSSECKNLHFLRKLKILDLELLYDDQIIDLKNHQRLETLILSNCKTRNVSYLKRLKQLTVDSSASIADVSLLTTLNYFQMRNLDNINDSFVENELNNMIHLRQLSLSLRRFNYEKIFDMKLLSNLTNLQRLDLNMPLKNLFRFTNLIELSMVLLDEKECMDQLVPLTKLRFVNFRCANRANTCEQYENILNLQNAKRLRTGMGLNDWKKFGKVLLPC